MSSAFPSITETMAFFQVPNEAKLAKEEKARRDALAERLQIPLSYGPPVLSTSTKEVEDSTASHSVVPNRPVGRQEGKKSSTTSEIAIAPKPKDSMTTAPILPRHSHASVTEALRDQISVIKAEVQGLKQELGIRNAEFEALNERLGNAERRYEEAIIDMRKNKEEKQELEDVVDRLRRQLEETRNAKEKCETQLATRQKEFFETLESLRQSEEQRLKDASRMEAGLRRDEILAGSSRREQDEVARMAEQIDKARREGRREGRRERKRSNVTLLLNERPQSNVAWNFLTGRTSTS